MEKWSKVFSNSTETHPVAQPLSCGDLVVFASDSLYYYSNATGFNQKLRISSGLNIKNMAKRFFYTLSEPSFIDIALYSLDGKIIHNVKKGLLPAGNNSLSLAGVAKGAYIVKMTSNRHDLMQERVVIY